MSVVTIDATGSLVIDGQKVFPIGLSDPPPLGGATPDGKDAWTEIANGGLGATFIRSGRTLASPWSLAQIDNQIAAEKARMDAAAAHGLHTWLRLVNAADLPAASGSVPEQLLVKIVNGLKGHAALGAYKGADEPEHSGTPADGLIRAYQKLKTLDVNHPVVITQAPVGPAANLPAYRPAFDITGADIYPIGYPPGTHANLANKDLSVVGEITRKMVTAAGGKPVWMTLQIAWSGVIPTQSNPAVVPRFPTLHDERFMAYQAIVNGARGLFFFGGQFTQVMRPRDALTGWNWTFWDLALKPLLIELNSPSVQPALLAPKAQAAVAANAADVELAARRSGNTLHVIAVRTSQTLTSQVQFTGLPNRLNGTALTGGQVMFEYAQSPPSPPVQPDKQQFRSVTVQNRSFSDWFGPHDVHVYRFNLA